MPPVSKVELYAAIGRDARAGMPGRAMERKYGAGRRTIIKALAPSHAGQTYLLIVLLPADLLAWLTGSAVLLAARRTAAPARALVAHRLRRRGDQGTRSRSAARWVMAATGPIAIVLLGLMTWLPAAEQARVAPFVASPSGAAATRYAARYIERNIPPGQVALTVEAAGETYVRSVTLGVVWALRAHGYEPGADRNHSSSPSDDACV